MNDSVMTPNQYQSSAYDSDKIKPQALAVRGQGLLEKLRKRGQTFSFSKANSSVATTAIIEDIASLVDDNESLHELYWNHKQMEPYKAVWWAGVYLFLWGMAWVVLYVIYPILIMLVIFVSFSDAWTMQDVFNFFLGSSLFVALPAALIGLPMWYFGKKDNISKEQLSLFVRKEYCLNRETGMVTLYGKNNRVIFEHPFIEFDCILASNPTHQGLVNYRLMLVHRYSNYSEGVNIGNMVGMNAPVAEYHRVWNMIQRYMDVSQPLPDIPMLEPFREYDPTTVEFDKLSKREPRYWRDMTEEQFTAEVRRISVEQEEQHIPASGPVINIFES